jgi:hypothetical protein
MLLKSLMNSYKAKEVLKELYQFEVKNVIMIMINLKFNLNVNCEIVRYLLHVLSV